MAISRPRVLALAALAALLCGDAASHLISRAAAHPPALPPLPARFDLAGMTTSQRLQSLGIVRLPHFERVRAGLCRGDAQIRTAWLDGLTRALAEPERPLELAYFELAFACSAEACGWFREQIDVQAQPVRSVMWRGLAGCQPLDDGAVFEREDAPAAAVVAFHLRRQRTDAIHSLRLAKVVETRLAGNEADRLDDALRAYERMDHPETGRHLLALHAAQEDPSLERSLVYAMRNQSEPAAARLFFERCHRDFQESMDRWRESGANPRGSPTRWGQPCRTATGAAWAAADAARPAAPPPDGPLADFPSELGKPVWLIDQPGWQFEDQSAPLWRIAELVRPDLDEAIFQDHWPAVDLVSIHRGPASIGVFVGGDGVTLHVPQQGSGANRAVAAEIRDELEFVLRQERVITAWFRGERLGFRYQPDRKSYDYDAILEIANTLLTSADSERRVARVKTPYGFVVLVATPAKLAEARARGLLAP